MKKINFAVIGCGVIAFTHAKALEANRDICELVAACDILPEKADQYAADHGAKKVYYDYHDVMEDEDIDVVCICVPSGIHGEVAMAAARAGKHIVCEKPMEITPQRIAEVTREVRECGVKMQCILQRRMMPVAIAVRNAVREGKLGKIVLADAYLKYYRDQEYYNSAGWRGTWELDGGGALMNQGIHGIDLVLWMLDDEVKSLFGRAETLARDIVVEDTAAAILKMRKGAVCVIESATSTYPGFSTTFAIYGEKGTVVFNDEQILEWTFLDEEDAPPRPDQSSEFVGGAKNPIQIGNDGHIRLLRDMAEAIIQGRDPVIPPEDAADAVKVICSIYESAKTGREIFF